MVKVPATSPLVVVLQLVAYRKVLAGLSDDPRVIQAYREVATDLLRREPAGIVIDDTRVVTIWPAVAESNDDHWNHVCGGDLVKIASVLSGRASAILARALWGEGVAVEHVPHFQVQIHSPRSEAHVTALIPPAGIYIGRDGGEQTREEFCHGL